MYGVEGKKLSSWYKYFLSRYQGWEQLHHASEYVLFKENLGERLSMDETSLSQGELYTIITNKSAHGGKGSLVAMIKGTKSEDVIYYLNHLPRTKRLKVKEITIDLSPSMRLIAKQAFPNATIVSDRFHVQKLMNEAVSDLRVDFRWQAIDQENKEIALAKELGRKFISHTFENGDTRRQLLARSRHVVMKHHSRWTDSQKRRARILFREYPAIEEAYNVSMKLTDIFNTKCNKAVALTKLARWYDEVERLNCKFFNSVIQTMQNNYATIVNYFENRSTNASAESFNAKVKAFRSQFRGISDIPFFIFRLATLFA
ncbi:MAG: transposase [Bacteroidales bacterium]|nr:transposase [Bacteroidales bacterium]